MQQSAPVPGSRPRAALRMAAGILGFCLLVAFGTTVLAGAGQPDWTGSMIALATIFAAFASLHWGMVATTNRMGGGPGARLRRQLRGCRVMLGLAAIVELVLYSGLPLPTTLRGFGPHVPIVAMLTATVGAAVLLRRAPRAAHALLAGLSLWGAFVVARLVWTIGRAEAIGPAYAVASLLIFCMVAGVWHALWAFGRVRPLLDAARQPPPRLRF